MTVSDGMDTSLPLWHEMHDKTSEKRYFLSTLTHHRLHVEALVRVKVGQARNAAAQIANFFGMAIHRVHDFVHRVGMHRCAVHISSAKTLNFLCGGGIPAELINILFRLI